MYKYQVYDKQIVKNAYVDVEKLTEKNTSLTNGVYPGKTNLIQFF